MYLIKRETYLKHTRNVIDWTSVFRNKSGDTADIKAFLMIMKKGDPLHVSH